MWDHGEAWVGRRKGNLIIKILIDILKNTLPNNSNLKASIINSF